MRKSDALECWRLPDLTLFRSRSSKLYAVAEHQKDAQIRFKGNKDYEKWKRETPMFVPKIW